MHTQDNHSRKGGAKMEIQNLRRIGDCSHQSQIRNELILGLVVQTLISVGNLYGTFLYSRTAMARTFLEP